MEPRSSHSCVNLHCTSGCLARSRIVRASVVCSARAQQAVVLRFPRFLRVLGEHRTGGGRRRLSVARTARTAAAAAAAASAAVVERGRASPTRRRRGLRIVADAARRRGLAARRRRAAASGGPAAAGGGGGGGHAFSGQGGGLRLEGGDSRELHAADAARRPRLGTSQRTAQSRRRQPRLS